MNKALLLFLVSFSSMSTNLDYDSLISGDVLNGVKSAGSPRSIMINNIATNYGIWFGRNDYINEINLTLEKYSKYFDQINFSYLVIDNNLLPPVVSVSESLYEYEDSNNFRKARKIYRIVKESEIVYSIPSWRTYIFLDEDINKPLLPKDLDLNKNEKKIWRSGIEKGVEIGKSHAVEEFEFQLNLLIRDYAGMILSHQLKNLNILDFSKLNEIKNGVIKTDTAINIDDRIVTKISNDVFKDINGWLPNISKSNLTTKPKNDFVFRKVAND